MPRFCANLDWLYTDLPLLDRIGAAAQDGFEGVEFLRPYVRPADELGAAVHLAPADVPRPVDDLPLEVGRGYNVVVDDAD